MSKNPDILLEEVRKLSPQIADVREIAAMIESFGYTDRSMKDWGFPDVFALAEHIYVRFPREAAKPVEVTKGFDWKNLGLEVLCALRKCSLSLAYAIQWIALLALQYMYPDSLQVSPELGGAMSLSLIASLVTTGGFMQMISRRGVFYYGLEQPFLARHYSIALLVLGAASTLVCSVLGIMVGTYFHLFPLTYLGLAALNYIGLSLLWMFCAVVSIQALGWAIPIIFLVSGAALIGLKLAIHPSTTLLLMLWPPLAVVCALFVMVLGFRHWEKKFPASKDSNRPRFGVSFFSIITYYLYGTAYFGFMFADRLAAGSAIPWTSGLSFGIDSAYTQGMDLVLLAFLLTAALTEYFTDSFLRRWTALASEIPQAQNDRLVRSLKRRHHLIVFLIVVVYVAMAGLSWLVFSRFFGMVASPRLLQTALIGGLGYMMLSISLLQNIILASKNSTQLALKAVAIGLGVNLFVGYSLSHFFGVQFAAVGLLTGAAVLLWISSANVRQALKHPDYYYSIS